jgi:hypothetical protein
MQSKRNLSLAELAGDAYSHFETRERPDGESYTTLRDSAPEWLHELVRSAHDDMLPDDWRYATIRSALGFISDTDIESVDDAHDAASEFADSNVDAYTGARLAWLSSHLSRAGYCDDAASEFGYSIESDGIVGLIGLGQYAEGSEVFASVVDSLSAQLA